MKVICDIDEVVYKAIKKTMQTTNRHLGKTMMLEHLMEVINEGIPLPKGHGDLKDMGNLKYVFDLTKDDPIYSGKDIERAIKSMTTIIEADKE